MKKSISRNDDRKRREKQGSKQFKTMLKGTVALAREGRLAEKNDAAGLTSYFDTVLRIRIFLGNLDPEPDPFVRGTDPAPDLDPSIIKQK
jgi:hypothetical protein